MVVVVVVVLFRNWLRSKLPGAILSGQWNQNSTHGLASNSSFYYLFVIHCFMLIAQFIQETTNKLHLLSHTLVLFISFLIEHRLFAGVHHLTLFWAVHFTSLHLTCLFSSSAIHVYLQVCWGLDLLRFPSVALLAGYLSGLFSVLPIQPQSLCLISCPIGCCLTCPQSSSLEVHLGHQISRLFSTVILPPTATLFHRCVLGKMGLFSHCPHPRTTGSFSKPWQQQDIHQTKGFMSKRIAMHNVFWIVVHFFAIVCKQQREMTKFYVFWRM